MDTHPIVKQRIQTLIASYLPNGAGTMTETRLRSALEQVAQVAWQEAENDVLMNLLTVDQAAEMIGVSVRRMRAIAQVRHERFGIGWKVPGTRGTWLFRPQEIEALRPGPSGNPDWNKNDQG